MFFWGGGGGGCCCCWSACGTAKHVAVASHCVQKRQNGGRITRSRLKALRVPSSWLLRGGGRSFQIWTRKMGTISLTTYELQIRKSQDPAKDLGERQVKPRRKFVNQKLWAIYRNITKLLYLKWKLNEKKKEKKRKDKKRSEEKNVLPEFELRPFGEGGDSSTTRPCGTQMHSPKFVEFLLSKPSSLIRHEFKDIFQKNKTPIVVSVGCFGPCKHNGVLSEFGKIRETGKMCHVMSIDE